jgi:hypothetical protein
MGRLADDGRQIAVQRSPIARLRIGADRGVRVGYRLCPRRVGVDNKPTGREVRRSRQIEIDDLLLRCCLSLGDDVARGRRVDDVPREETPEACLEPRVGEVCSKSHSRISSTDSALWPVFGPAVP